MFVLFWLAAGAVFADYQVGLDAYSHGDYAKAMKEWRAVTDGPATAVNPAIYVETHYAVAMLYWQGQGVAQDYGQAKEWLLKAARMNHAGAQAKLGYLYTDGVSVPQDYDQAFEWFSKAARGGNVDGLYNLGIFYLYGWGVEQDPTMAAQYLAAASALGDRDAEAALQQVLAQIEAGIPARVPPLEALPEPDPVGANSIRDQQPESGEANPIRDQQPQPVGANSIRDGEPEVAEEEEFSSESAPEKSRIESAPTDAAAQDTSRIESAPTDAAAQDTSRIESAPTDAAAQDTSRIESAPIVAATEDPEQVQSPVLDEAWIRAQDPEHYTIQVMALRSRDTVVEFMEKYKDFAPFAVFTVQKGSTPLHVMLQGNYADVESARLAKERFPSEIQRQDALWIRRFGMVQRLLE